MPIPLRPDSIIFIAEPRQANLTIAVPHSDTQRYEYRQNGGSWVSVAIGDRSTSTTTRLRNLQPETDYKIEVRSVNGADRSDTLEVAFSTPPAISTRAPVWRNIYVVIVPRKSVSVNLSNAAPRAAQVSLLSGLRRWMSFANGVFRVTNAPIADKYETAGVHFRAENAHGDAVTRVTVIRAPTREAYLSKSLYCVGRGSFASDAGRTASPLTIRATGDFDFIVLVSKDVDAYSLGSLFTDRVPPSDVRTVEGSLKSTRFDTKTYDLIALEHTHAAGNYQLTFSGTGATVYSVHYLKEGWVIDANLGYTEIVPGKVDRIGVLNEEAKGGISRDARVADARHRYTCDYTAVFDSEQEAEDFMWWCEQNLHFFHIEEFNRRPHRMYEAVLGTLEIASEFLTRFREVGSTMSFRVEER